jgi:hypothetical protein
MCSGLGARLPRRIGDVGENDGCEYTEVGLDGWRCEAVMPSRVEEDEDKEDGSAAVAIGDERCGAATASKCGCVCASG